MSEPQSRAEQKERTRRAILDTALHLTRETPLAALSLRHVAREAGIAPASFYRHFNSTDALGLALVEESYASLRAVLREIRRGRPEPREVVRTSVSALMDYAQKHRDHFEFIARERFAGPPVVREAVRHQLELIENELAVDLAIMTSGTWTGDDLRATAKLIVSAMVANVAEFLVSDRDSAAELEALAETQLKMLAVGWRRWRSNEDEANE